MAKRRSFTAEFKAQVVLELVSGAKTAAEICREHDIKPQLLSTWKTQFLENAPSVFASDRTRDGAQERIVELERLLGQKTLELEVAKKASNILQSQQSRNGRW
jgi:transposase-like protein